MGFIGRRGAVEEETGATVTSQASRPCLMASTKASFNWIFKEGLKMAMNAGSRFPARGRRKDGRLTCRT